jgi:hypothetical protein
VQLPANLSTMRRLRETVSQANPDPRGIAIGPGCLDQRPPCAPVAGQSEALASDGIASRTLRRDKTEERHQLSWRIEPAHVADLRGKDYRDEERRAAHRLIGFHDCRHGPLGDDESELLLEATQPLKSILDRVDSFLKDDLLGDMLELLIGQPAPVRQRPMAASAVNPAVTQQEGKQLLAFAAKVIRRRLAGPHKIAHRLMRLIRRLHARQFAGSMQPRQRDRVAPVRLDPLARSFRDQGRRDHHAIMTERLDLTIKPVSRRPGFEADMQPLVSFRQLLDRSLDRQRAVLDIAEKSDLSRTASFRDCNGVLLLGDVESHKDFAILSHGPPSVHAAPARHARATLVLTCTKGRATASARKHDV